MSAPTLQRTLSGIIAIELREAILSGAYPAGAQLRQDALAQSFGTSRIPVREALFQLDAEGLVRITPQKGAVVSELSASEIADVFELRAILEPRLLDHALGRGEGIGLDRAEAIHQRFVAATAANDIREWGTLNAEFHMALYEGADLPRTAQMAAALLQTSDRYTRVQLSRPEAMRRAVEEHAALLALCRAGDRAEACGALRSHIMAVGDDLLRVVRTRRSELHPEPRPRRAQPRGKTMPRSPQ
jgi:DNA-binding GntR family transcriptional regulator